MAEFKADMAERLQRRVNTTETAAESAKPGWAAHRPPSCPPAIMEGNPQMSKQVDMTMTMTMTITIAAGPKRRIMWLDGPGGAPIAMRRHRGSETQATNGSRAADEGIAPGHLSGMPAASARIGQKFAAAGLAGLKLAAL